MGRAAPKGKGDPGAGGRVRHPRRWAAAAVAILALALAYGWLVSSFDTDAIERLINRAIVPASGGVYRIHLDAARVSPLAGTVSISGANLLYDPEAVGALAEQGRSPTFLLQVRVGEFQVRGVRVIPLLLRRAIIAESLEVDSADIATMLRIGGSGEPAAEPDATPPSSATEAPIEERARQALRGVPRIQVDTIRISGAGGTITILDGSQRERIDRVRGIELDIDGLHIHSEATLEEVSRLYSRDVRLAVEEISLAAGITAQQLALSTGDRSVQLAGLRLDPDSTVPEYLSRPTVREPDRVAVSVGRVALTGLDPLRALSRNELVVEELSIAGFRVEILHDKHKPGGQPHPQPQPHDLVGALPFRLRVDTIRLTEGFVAYSERDAKGQRPGTLTFEQVSGTITGLDTGVGQDPDETPAPVVAQLQTSLMGAAHATVVFRLPLWEPKPTMRVEGRIDSFDARALNGILTPLLGAEVASGKVNSTAFEIAYGPRVATGHLDIFYEDARLRLTDRDGGGQNLGNRIVSFAANAFGVHDANPSRPGQAPRPGVIDVPFDETWPFFKLLWVPIREALIKVLRKI